jgi:hypothetical protein
MPAVSGPWRVAFGRWQCGWTDCHDGPGAFLSIFYYEMGVFYYENEIFEVFLLKNCGFFSMKMALKSLKITQKSLKIPRNNSNYP